jgi:hypothetical protein
LLIFPACVQGAFLVSDSALNVAVDLWLASLSLPPRRPVCRFTDGSVEAIATAILREKKAWGDTLQVSQGDNVFFFFVFLFFFLIEYNKTCLHPK